MTDLEVALAEAAAALDECSIPFMLIGGLAVSAWGEARSTLDVDLAVWAETEFVASAVGCLCQRLKPRSSEPLRFVQDTRVLPLQSSAGIRLDVVFGVLPLQREAIGRAVPKPLAGRMIPTASLEDLVLMKLVSERRKDLDDVRGLLRRHSQAVDREYLVPKLVELAEALARPDIISIFQREITSS
jgi:hypothetical protein